MQKWRQENREQYLESVRVRYNERKIEQKVIGKETELNPEHVAVVKARWFHEAEREALLICTQKKFNICGSRVKYK